MNIEEQGLLYYLADEEVYTEYGENLVGAVQLESGKWFNHASKLHNMSAFGRMDNRINNFKIDALLTYMEYVDPQKGTTVE